MDYNRDLLYVQPHDHINTVVDVAMLHKLLHGVENIHHMSKCVEILDFNKLKVIKKIHLVEQVLRQPSTKPFQFVNTLN